MRHRVRVPADFLLAPEFPGECLFTGQTDGVERLLVTLVYKSLWRRVAQFIWWLNLFSTGKQLSVQVSVPQRRPSWFHRMVRHDYFWIFWLLTLPTLIVMVGPAVVPMSLHQTFVATLTCGAVVFVCAVCSRLWLWRSSVSLHVINMQAELEISFPAAQRERAERYRQALELYRTRLQDQAAAGAPHVPNRFSADWTAAAPALAWQSPPAVAAPAGADAERPVARTLTVTSAFMNSVFLPHRCFLSGRTDRVERMREPVRLVGGFLRLQTHTGVVIPEAPGARAWWNFQRNLGWWLGLLLPLGFLFLGISLESISRTWMLTVYFSGLFVGPLVGVVTGVWMRKRLVSFKLVDAAGGLALYFPASHAAGYQVFAEAYVTYQEAVRAAAAGQAPVHLEPAGKRVGPDRDEAWAEQNSGGWDHGG